MAVKQPEDFKTNIMKKEKRMYAPAQGSDAIWDGPLDLSSMPKGKGSSRGANGIKLLAHNAPAYISGPISKIAEGTRGLGMN
jgi:hypothetical protein|tara:strand:+ start:228 stop:473 length:246 start_codon:yes stop_codon:yes gene_type:complete